MLKCPIYNTVNACAMNSNCLFLRNGGCSIVLGATIAEENQKAILVLSQQVQSLSYQLSDIAQRLSR